MYLSFVNADQIKHLSDKFSKNYSNISGAIIDTISNIQSTKIFGHEELEHSYLQNILVKFKQDFVAKELFLLKFWIKQSISIILLVLVVLLSLVYLKSQNLITVGDFAFILGLVLCVCENIWEFTQQFGQVNDMIGKCRQSLKSLVITDFEENYITTTDLPSNCPEIEFQNVIFYHEPESIPLKIDNLKIKPYEKIGIVGYSGSGKSTFVNLILRLFQTDSGRILIGYKNINNISKNSLRSIISAISQNPILFHRTIADNISYGNSNATQNDILQAAIKAGAHEFITSLPKGYNTMVGEMGLKLSGGQRQRIAMARLILKQPQILILDEATSQLDSFTETIIQESLKEIMSGKTSIVITHRLSTITNMDRILVFDKGKIVGDGTHSTLLANNSIYKKLWRNSIK
jgi:ATP-binding cassette subfamily B protein